jgi:pimeloyl-ACP methyl ester carboxylesterase
MADTLTGGLRRISQWPETLSWAKRLGVVSGTLDDELWHEITESTEAADLDRVLAFVEVMGEHDVSAILPTIDVPTLIISGDRDVVGTREAAEHLARTIRGAELMTVPGGGHFVAAEYPELVSLRIEKFLRERGYADPIPSRRPGAEVS